MSEILNVENNSKIYKRICSLEIKDNIWNFYDCGGNELTLSAYRFPSAMNTRYRQSRNNFIKRDDISCVWILVGIENNRYEIEKWIQVGRSKHLTNLLSEDVKEDVKAIFSNDEGKYSNLKADYKKLVFYEVNIDELLKNDNDEALNEYKIEPQNEKLKLIYHYMRAAYTEAKLGYYSKAKLYHTSTVDGFYYEYFKEKEEN